MADKCRAILDMKPYKKRKDTHKGNRPYPVVGRNGDVDLRVYLTEVNGRQIIDYEKLKMLEPELYQKIIAEELREEDEN